jgi:uncharacterized protein
MSGAARPAQYPSWLQVSASAISVRVRAKPGSSRRGVIRVDPDALVIGLHSPAQAGRANDELIELLASAAGVPRSAATIVRGAGNRDKLIAITARDAAASVSRLIEFARLSPAGGR